jgi:DUF1365 family protein
MRVASAIYAGHVMHRRVRPRRHKLNYRLFMLLLDLDEIDALAHRLRFFSRNRHNLFSFRDADYGAGDTTPLRSQVERHLRAADLAIEGGTIRLLTMPRVLGFAFNPLSVYFCYDASGELAAIIYEVNNTFGQRHSYLLPVNPGNALPIRQTTAKMFHVSPFMSMDMDYAFRVMPPSDRLGIAITGATVDGPIITAALVATRHELSDATLLRAFVTYPLVTFTVVAGIVWEATKLWMKGVPVRRRPPPPEQSITGPVRIARNHPCT